MAAAAILKIAFLAITHQLIFWFQRNFALGSRQSRQKLQIFKIQDGGWPPFWKSLNLQISVKMSDFTEIWYIIYWTRLQSTIEFFKIQDGGDRHLENRFFGHNSLTDCPMSAKVCMRKQHGMPTNATWQKLQIFKIQDGGWPPFWKSLNRHIRVKNCIDAFFGTVSNVVVVA